MQLVRHVLEEFSRFNLEAIMETEIELQSLSPETRCRVIADTSVAEHLQSEIYRLEDELDSVREDLRCANQGMQEALQFCKEGKPGAASDILKETLEATIQF